MLSIHLLFYSLYLLSNVDGGPAFTTCLISGQSTPIPKASVANKSRIGESFWAIVLATLSLTFKTERVKVNDYMK